MTARHHISTTPATAAAHTQQPITTPERVFAVNTVINEVL
jgi:hypothetical protein